MNDDEETKLLGKYVWSSNGGCEICDAMNGEYDEEPSRPHENCQCEIAYYRSEDCKEDDVNVAFFDFEFPSPDIITYIFDVTCKDGTKDRYTIDTARKESSDYPEGMSTEMQVESDIQHAIDLIDFPDGCSKCDAPRIV
jgi:hypothetical protein